MTQKTTRRNFIGQSAAVTAGVGFFTSTKPDAFAQESALQSPAAASVGIGGKGDSDSSHVAKLGCKMVGICDIDGARLKKKGREKSCQDAEQFTDFREMFDKLGDKFDMVTISTPDHTHAVAALRALNMKKHVYCQKPMTWSIREARLLREAAEANGVHTQMGNQGTSEDGLREAVEVIQSGAIGDVTDVHVWTNRPVWPQGIGRPAGEDPVPADINWDAWIGPAPMRPYKKGVYHSFKWRGWVDFGTGALGDMACHTTNMPVMALKLWDPIAITAVKNPGVFEGETFPGSSQLLFEFPEREGLKPCKFHWYDGGNLPADDVLAQLPKRFQKLIEQQKQNPNKKTSGSFFIGSKGAIFSPDDYGSKYILLPEEDYVDYKPPAQTLPRIPYQSGRDIRQKWEWVQAIKGEYEPGPMSNFSYAGRLTETILVGNLAMRGPEGKRIEWDAKTMTSPNVPEVNEFTTREYRSGWELPS